MTSELASALNDLNIRSHLADSSHGSAAIDATDFKNNASTATDAHTGTSSGSRTPAVRSFSADIPQSTLLHELTESFDASSFFAQLGKTDYTKSIGVLSSTSKPLDWIEQFETTLLGLGLAPFLEGHGTPIMDQAVRYILRTTLSTELKDSYLSYYGSTYDNYCQMRASLLRPRYPGLIMSDLEKLRFDGSCPPVTFFSRFNTLKNELERAQGGPAPEYQMVQILLGSLSADYFRLRDILISQKTLSVASIRAELETHYSYREIFHAMHRSDTTSSDKTKTSTKPTKKCTFCNRFGHTVDECRTKARTEQVKQVGNVTLTTEEMSSTLEAVNERCP